MSKRLSLRHVLLASSALVPLGAIAALANPLGGTVVGGSAQISGTGTSHVIINQGSQNAIINWHTFNIGSGERVQFVQPNAGAAALNRVTGGMGPSSIHGVLDANGRVFLVNPDGVLFGSGSRVSTAGFLATTSDITNADFMAGRYHFNIPGRPDASIVNNGIITAHSQGFAALVAPGVRNSGTITAQLGTVGLASANTFSLDFYGDQLIKLAPNDAISATVRDVETGLPLDALVKNEGLLQANGGRVELTAVAARTVVDSVINNTGVIEARSVGTRNGKIVLGAATGDNGYKQTVKVSGKLDVSSKSGKGGKIQVTGQHIEVKAASFDASGSEGGGRVLIGGDTGGGHGHWAVGEIPQAGLEPGGVPNATTVSIDAGTTINASATGVGNGGKVIVWADGSTSFSGQIFARGGDAGGDGGFVEVSGKHFLTFNGMVNTLAPYGKAGTVLFDPDDFEIKNCTMCGANTISASQVVSLLENNGNQIFTTSGPSGDLIVSASVVWNGNSTLTLSGHNDVQFKPNVVVQNINGSGNLIVRADSDGIGGGSIVFDHGTDSVRIDWTGSTGTVKFYENPQSGYGQPTDFTPTGQGPGKGVLVNNVSQYQYWMLVNSVADFQNISQNISAQYALGRNIDGGGATINPLTNFSGEFDGLNNTISNLIIAGQAAVISNTGTIKNLTLSNFQVSAIADGQFVGMLVGVNNGTIDNVHTSGTVTGSTLFGSAGGIVGENFGLIVNSTSSAAVTVGNGLAPNNPTPFSTFTFAGGLAGRNFGTIRGSSAIGSVSGGNFSFIGGIAGANGFNASFAGVIENSSASGPVTSAGHTVAAGGVAGVNFQSSSITGSSASGNVTVGSGIATTGWTFAGGAVGVNIGNIINTEATGNVTAGSNAFAGGFAGSNGFFGMLGFGSATGYIEGSSASGSVSSTGTGVALGGVAGINTSGSTIVDSSASGNVTASSGLASSGLVSSAGYGGIYAGGLIGINAGNVGTMFQSYGTYAEGDVYVGSHGVGGGLVGINTGIIEWAHAFGNVTGASGSSFDHQTVLGGLVGANHGITRYSYAFGDVGTADALYLLAGGVIGRNSGLADTVGSGGNVTTGNFGMAGGAIGANEQFACANCTIGTGSSAFNTTTVIYGLAAGSVTVGRESLAGGLIGLNSGSVTGGAAVVNVTGGGDSVLGGFVGANDPGGSIVGSAAYGIVTSTGATSWIGGFVGLNGGDIEDSGFLGVVSATSTSVLGGFAGVNAGRIADSVAFAGLQTSGSGNVIGGFAGANFGLLQDPLAEGSITATGANIAGSLVGINGSLSLANASAASLATPAAISTPNTFPVGTVNGGTANVSITSGPGSTTGAFIASTDATRLPSPFPAIIANCDSAACTLLTTASLLPGTDDHHLHDLNPIPDEVLAPPNSTIANVQPNLMPPVEVLIQITPPVEPPGTPGAGPQQQGAPSQVPGTQPVSVAPAPAYIRDNGLPSGLPPVGETRFNQTQVLVQFPASVSQEQVNQIAQQFGLTVLTTTNSAGGVTIQFQLGAGQNVRNMIRALERLRELGIVQPNYTYTVLQANPPTNLAQAKPQAIPPVTADTPRGDPAQYMMDKLHLPEAHRVASGSNISIAVIDSEVDPNHAELSGTILESFDATNSPARPHSHGTAMAGAIVARDRLLGVAPGARILAVRAFSETQATAESTTVTIIRSIEWAISRGARVINMSFAGPYDPSLERALKDAAAKGVIMIAASGNAGPKSKPLWPSADPNVIAVTATDSRDRLFRMANRGAYVSVASPGVEILAPAPESGYQMSTGTSIATAHVSGIVALMLERDPSLTPKDVRLILETTASDLGPRGRDVQYGWGLVNPQRALEMVDELKRKRGSSQAPAPANAPVQR